MTFSSTISTLPTTGLFNHPLFNRHLFATPEVRHLAWLVHSRPILEIDARSEGAKSWPADVDSLLLDLDCNPAPLLEHLARRNSNRLGLYFEQLYGYALTEILGQRILAQNLPVRAQGRTLGELDFLVHDPARDQMVHHEIAVKFYMGWTNKERVCTGQSGNDIGRASGWYGPDTRDQLSAKLQRLREHQIPMWQSEVGLQCLREEGLAAPEASHLGLYGYLFLHQDGAAPALPEGIRAPDPNISWRRVTEQPPENGLDTCMAVLRKPHWLGPLQCPEEHKPEPKQQADICAEAESRPLLLATLQRTAQGFWLETHRQFVVPEHWCAPT